MLSFRPTQWLALALASVGVLAQSKPDDFQSVNLRTHSLSVPYLDSDMQSRWFDFGGDAIVRTDRYIRLASDKQSRSGYIFSKVPLTATNWQLEVEFKITGNGHLYGDGFAMWLTKQRATQGPVFGSADRFEGLGIFFDTYKNNRPGTVFPYVMAMLGDGTKSYDKSNDGKENELAGCSARGIRNANVPTKARLTYIQDKNLAMDLMYKEDGEWTSCFDVPNVKIPNVAYLGFSAETGELTDNFDIISVDAKNLYSAGWSGPGQASKDHPGAGQNYGNTQSSSSSSSSVQSSSGGSWSWFFLKVVFFLVLCAGGYAGFTAYRTQRRSSRF